jgi:hypothetical protein
MRTMRLALTGTVILALLGGLGGAVVAQDSEMTPMPDDGTTFPTGTFVAAEWSDRFLEFNEDGTCRWTAAWGDRAVTDCIYAVDADLYTEVSHEWPGYEEQVPATYHWDYDGEYLTFELRGEESMAHRQALYEEQPYRHVPNPRLVVMAGYDIAAGTELLAGHTELRVVPGDETPADALTDRDLATGSVAAVAILKGQPITPDLLEVSE